MTDTTLNRFLSRGTNAQRLAFTPSPPTPASGPSPLYIWYETDTGDTYAYDGSWHKVNSAAGANPTATASDAVVNGVAATFMRSDAAPAVQKGSSSAFGVVKVDNTTITATGGVISAVAGPGASARMLISEVVTSGSQSSVSFTSISSAFRDLRIAIRGRSTNASSDTQTKFIFNSDTGSNYMYLGGLFSDSAAPSTNNNNTGATSLLGPYLPANSAAANYAGVVELFIGDYRGTAFFKAITWMGASFNGTGSGNRTLWIGDGLWRSTSAITRVDVSFSSGNFVDGSVVSLYGLM